MAKEKMEMTKALRSIGAVEVERENGQITLQIDPAKIPVSRRKRMAEGISKAVASQAQNSPFLPEFFEGPGNVGELGAHDSMRIAMLYFKTDPLVGKIIEVMKSMALEGFKNEDSDPKRKEWFDRWCDAVDFEQVLGWILLEWFRSGNVNIVRELVQASVIEGLPIETEVSTSVGSEDEDGDEEGYEKAVAAKKYLYSKASVPGAYTVLNPLTVYVAGTAGDREQLVIRNVDGANFPSADYLGINITNFDTKRLKEKVKELGGVPLYKKNVSRILRQRQPYEDYGQVLMERAFAPLYVKNKMRQAELSMLNSSINRILQVTIGNNEFPATQPQLNKLVRAFINTGKSQTIFWNHTLDIKLIEPKFEPFDDKRYHVVDNDIRNAFGISEVMMGGGTGKTSPATGLISLKVFVTNMRDARVDVKRWIRLQYKDIAKAMGFNGIPEPTFSEMALTDELGEKQIIMQLLDRGVISYSTAQSVLGYDPQVELNRRKKEHKDVVAGIFGPVQAAQAGSPYQAPKDEGGKVPASSEAMGGKKNMPVPKSNKPGPEKSGTEGRPQTPKGKPMPNRKSPTK